MRKNTTTAVALARTAKVNPKVARRRLREAGIRRPKNGWVFTMARAKEITKVIAA